VGSEFWIRRELVVLIDVEALGAECLPLLLAALTSPLVLTYGGATDHKRISAMAREGGGDVDGGTFPWCDLAEDVGRGGLQRAVGEKLGLRVEKIEQKSDWKRRPLRDAQVAYAALDAYILLQLATRCAGGVGDVDEAAIERRYRRLGAENVAEAVAASGLACLIGPAAGIVAKTLGVECLGRLVVVVLPSAAKLDLTKLVMVMGGDCKLVPLSKLPLLFGYLPGSLGPFGLRDRTTVVVVDVSLRNHPAVSVGAGDPGLSAVLSGEALCSLGIVTGVCDV